MVPYRSQEPLTIQETLEENVGFFVKIQNQITAKSIVVRREGKKKNLQVAVISMHV